MTAERLNQIERRANELRSASHDNRRSAPSPLQLTGLGAAVGFVVERLDDERSQARLLKELLQMVIDAR